MGGAIAGRDVEFVADGGRLQGRLGGAVIGADLVLERSGDRVTGRIGGALVGFDVDVAVRPDGSVAGRLGGSLVGYDVRFKPGVSDPLLATAVAAVACWEMVHRRRVASGASS